MQDAEVLSCVRRLRRLVVTLDSIGFPVRELVEDEEIGKLVKDELPNQILNVSTEVHLLVQNIEKSKKYKTVIQNLCGLKLRGK